MQVRVKLFARARDLAGTQEVEVALAEGATVGELRRVLAAQVTALAGLLTRSAVAINDDFADDHQVVPPNSEIALLPPVSGGAR
jgi:molybdopterin converting factor subunit 1